MAKLELILMNLTVLRVGLAVIHARCKAGNGECIFLAIFSTICSRFRMRTHSFSVCLELFLLRYNDKHIILMPLLSHSQSEGTLGNKQSAAITLDDVVVEAAEAVRTESILR